MVLAVKLYIRRTYCENVSLRNSELLRFRFRESLRDSVAQLRNYEMLEF